MKIAIVSDDLTGASDCGAQLVSYGLDVSVMMQPNGNGLIEKDAIIFNTDSRSVSEEEAYLRVKGISEQIKKESFDEVYKKIDSTMRGNIGQEINAMYDVFQPDFVFIAPAYPKNGRKIVNGVHFLNQKQLHETEVGNDPKTPVSDSCVTRLIQNQAKRKVEHLTYKDLKQGYAWVVERLKTFKKHNISYVTVDSTNESDLECLIQLVKKTEFSVVWVGSAGLIQHLPKAYGLKQMKSEIIIPNNENPVLLVIGSVSETGREQLDQLLLTSNVVGIEMPSTKVMLDNVSKESELKRLLQEARIAFQKGKNVALYSSKTVKQTQKLGKKQGLNAIQISNRISKVLGEIANQLIHQFDIRGLFLTGGDTAQQVFHQLHVDEFQLIGEVESGIPIGWLNKDRNILVVTKAGSFGSKEAMVKAVFKLQGKEYNEGQIMVRQLIF
ncbi:four-carbon acid sugar kinase family protein [Metabacillus arenae]|uniref:Four-carbon acid sugar kinase family protein n=1 Tax=Metabacillus arenae TaxID=2771434 RepID=A0A926NKW6_9BACI|nr:four-carbon acid sugar kinase family protein [Metabacillus arenae]MBD1379902.1 four-carbon acid sugar kinase family protein [Metabacillus arenae]